MFYNRTCLFCIYSPKRSVSLFVVPYSRVYAIALELCRNGTYVSLAVVVGEHYLWLDHLGSLYQLVSCHRIRLVAGQESDVDVLDGLHFRNVHGGC